MKERTINFYAMALTRFSGKYFPLIKKLDIFYQKIKAIRLLTIIAYLKRIRRGKVTCQLVTSNYIIRF